ncbi:MAG: hypothetical protein KAJ24_02610 [Candidatus Aenigmarchaeota archaeon]|nr:hypothetical protein [Candidatus Aenigmarchaeota archaeon]
MHSRTNKLSLSIETSAFAGTCIGNLLVGAGVLLLIGSNLVGAPLLVLGIVALVPTYYSIRSASDSDSALIVNPVPMFLSVVHERSRTHE